VRGGFVPRILGARRPSEFLISDDETVLKAAPVLDELLAAVRKRA